jgi:hypothetical protein
MLETACVKAVHIPSYYEIKLCQNSEHEFTTENADRHRLLRKLGVNIPRKYKCRFDSLTLSFN